MKNQPEWWRVARLMRSRLAVYILSCIVCAIVITLALNLVMAFVLKDGLNAAVQHNFSLIKRAIGMVLIAFFVGEQLLSLMIYIRNWCIARTIRDVREEAFRKLTRLTVKQFETSHSGDLLTRLTNNIDNIESIYMVDFYSIIAGLSFTLFALGFIFWMEWRLGLITLVLNLISIALGLAFQKPSRKVGDQIKQDQAALTMRFLDLVQGTVITKMFHISEVILNRHKHKNQDLTTDYLQQANITAAMGGAMFFYGACKVIGVLIAGLFMLMRHEVDLGSIVAILFMQGYAGILFENLGWVIPHIQESLAGAKRVFELLDYTDEAVEFRPSPSPMGVEAKITLFEVDRVAYPGMDKTPSIVVDNVSFEYAEGQDSSLHALKGVDLTVEKGSITALVGRSGSGKSTLVKLLMGFYPLQKGEINLEGKSVKTYELKSLRDFFAYVPQDAYLFDGTIKENIGYGKPAATEEEITQAARQANAHEFILAQPQGYETVVGEKGARLSGGQKQRIAIARALLKNAPILLLDEATSALDSESESLVQEALEILMKGRTTIAIAHRLSTIQHAHMIYVMENGQVVEQGSHEVLVNQGGVYTRLYQLQFMDRANQDQHV